MLVVCGNLSLLLRGLALSMVKELTQALMNAWIVWHVACISEKYVDDSSQF